MKRQPLLLALSLILSISLVGCDVLGGEDDESSFTTAAVLVANQGNFGDGNGTITTYDPESETAQSPAISGLGSIVQGIAVQDTRLFIAANSGARVDVFSTDDLSQTGQITDLSGPRYFAFTDENTAFVTDQTLAGPSDVKVLDLADPEPELSDSIEVSGNPEGITPAGSRVYASLGAFGATTLVAAIDASDNSLVEEIDVGCASRFLVTDTDAEVYAFCTDAAEAVVLDGSSGQIEKRLSLPDTAESASSIGQPVSVSPEVQEIYATTDSGILRIDTETNEHVETLDVKNPSSIGGLAYDGLRDELYLARTSGFTEAGTVTIHDRDGTQKDSFEAGIAPTYVTFQRVDE